VREIDDRTLAAYLTAMALLEIRALAGRAGRAPEVADPAEALARIRFLADLCENMPLGPPRRRSRTTGRTFGRDRSMRERPMSYVWQISGPEKRQWMEREIERAGFQWTPPPPLPVPQPGPVGLSLRERAGLTGWPVKGSAGRSPLPREARVLKAVDGEGLLALYDRAGEGTAGPSEYEVWLRAHVDLAARHFLFPDPTIPARSDAGTEDGRWWCRALVLMVDGEQVRTTLPVRADAFRALPSTESRLRQRRLASIALATERDFYLWRRDHDPACASAGKAVDDEARPS
jgi:hypothetical protein